MIPHRDERDSGGCAIAAVLSETGEHFGPEMAVRAVANMHERTNGLGGGFAAYGIYPEHKDHWAIHIMCNTAQAKSACEPVLSRRCDIHADEPIPTRPVRAVQAQPILHRYFVSVKPNELERNYELTDEDVIVELVMGINAKVDGAFVFSSGKNMGIFKGVGFPEDIADFFELESYEAHMWIAHGRFPTNTTGWWGGAHPFGLLDWAVVHNGEISSYGINRRYLANFNYQCALQTDTEVIAYLFDLLIRKQGLPLEVACMAMAPPFWSQIQRMDAPQKQLARAVRMVYGGALLNGPFSIVVGHSGGMIALSDRTKLRPMVAARKGDLFCVASEEAAVRELCPHPEKLWHARGGVPLVGRLEEHREPHVEPDAFPARSAVRTQ
jgi:glutamate synthase domain-containing protein 1